MTITEIQFFIIDESFDYCSFLGNHRFHIRIFCFSYGEIHGVEIAK
jgi:hypothetical protein